MIKSHPVTYGSFTLTPAELPSVLNCPYVYLILGYLCLNAALLCRTRCQVTARL